MGWDWPDDAAAALAGGHTAVARVDVLHSGQPVAQLAVIDGQVSIDADRLVRSNLGCSLVDPTGNLSRADAEDLLGNPACEVAPWRGVRVKTTTIGSLAVPNAGFGLQPFGISGFGGVDMVASYQTSFRDELAPLGVYQLTNRGVSDSVDGLKISLTGQDRAILYQGPMESPLGVSGGTPVEDAIAQLLARRNPGVTLLAMNTGFTCGPLIFPPDSDVWAEGQKLAESVGGRLFHDPTGQCVLALAGPVSDEPVARYAQGGGLLIDVDRAEDWDTIRNVVVAQNREGTISAVAADTDPSSPTFAGGDRPRRVFTLINQHIASVEQALQAATARLAYELGRSETVKLSVVPDPGRYVDEVITAHRPRSGLVERGVVVANLEIPLRIADRGRGDPMTIGCRQSRLARDGRELPTPLLVAA